jgi:(1->4)-alpha-D-glucan 1-alpha-D-glucosylmutase
VVEKILEPGEHIPASWPVEGTTGYEFANDSTALFVDPAGEEPLTQLYAELTGERCGFHEVAREAERELAATTFRPEVERLRGLLDDDRWHEAVAALPVYRTYVDHRGRVHEDDRDVIARAVERARERWGKSAAVDRIAGIMNEPGDEDAQPFVGRLQQTSGPATAKGVEDTALYRYVPLASLNEVGGDPARDLPRAVADFHRVNAARASRWPKSLLTTSTHDTKRGADVRSRLDVLSEVPDEWIDAARRWRRMLAGHRTRVRGGPAPDAATEWLLYQTMLGIWPAESEPREAARAVRDRVIEYMTKANREAKVRTSWTTPDESYERAVETYVGAALANDTFIDEMATLASRVAPAGYCNALTRLAAHLTAPGIPDIYQGDEMWNFTLVDPDNRRPVDFDARRAGLERIDAAVTDDDAATACADMLRDVADGRIKLHLTRTALRLRRHMADVFTRGTYRPLEGSGDKAEHLLAFMRQSAGGAVITVGTRLPLSLGGTAGVPTGLAWGPSTIILQGGDVPHRWRCALTGRTIEAHDVGGDVSLALREVFLTLPVALLVAV